jgi:DNA-binding NarL/FixJ family response regulator
MITLARVKRVLVVDDVRDLRMLLRMALDQDEAFEVIAEAADGVEAIEQASLHQPDLVVLDLSMPVLDGLEALPRILESAPGTRVVVLSGFEGARMRGPALAAGAVGYVEKGDIYAVVEALRRLA